MLRSDELFLGNCSVVWSVGMSGGDGGTGG